MHSRISSLLSIWLSWPFTSTCFGPYNLEIEKKIALRKIELQVSLSWAHLSIPGIWLPVLSFAMIGSKWVTVWQIAVKRTGPDLAVISGTQPHFAWDVQLNTGLNPDPCGPGICVVTIVFPGHYWIVAASHCWHQDLSLTCSVNFLTWLQTCCFTKEVWMMLKKYILRILFKSVHQTKQREKHFAW